MQCFSQRASREIPFSFERLLPEHFDFEDVFETEKLEGT